MPEIIRNATWEEVEAVLEDPGVQIGLAGPRGVGKTSACFRAAEKLEKYAAKIQLHAEFSPSEAMGFYAPGVDKATGQQAFIWIPGPAELCYRKGGMLILDEVVEASGPMKTYMYGLLDRGPGGTISHVGRVFKQRPGYQAIATMNEWPNQGALPEALLDRFDAWFIMLQPHPFLLDLLDDDLRVLCEAAYQAAAEPPTNPGAIWDPIQGPDITFRMMLGFQRLRERLPVDIAAKAACYGDGDTARNFLEVLALSVDIEDDEEEEDDVDEEPEDEEEDDDDLDLDDGDD